MRPFDCHVTILNTLDPLGKFDGKADEGFLVGYSFSSKAFRVFNSRTKIVQETLHINFLENQPNVARKNQPNSSVGIQENLNAGKVMKEAESAQQYVLLPLWSTCLKDPQNTDFDAAFIDKENESEVYVSPSSSDKTKKHDEKVNAASAPVTGVRPNSTNSTNSFSAVGPSNTAVSPSFAIGEKSSFVVPSQYPDDPNMPGLENIIYSNDTEDVGAEADFSNLETSIVSPIPITRVHKDHPEHTQKEGINYEEVFAPVARIEAIWLFLAYASFMVFMVYVDDIIFGSTNKDLCKAFKKLMKDKFQMSSMGERTFFLGLQVKQKDNEIFISQDKYVAEILRKFGLADGKSASTPIDTEKPLLKDPDGEDVDVHIYRSFRYLKGKLHLGLWYPKDSPFNLVAYSDSDYAGASLDRKSTTGGCQFLGCRLISWQFKKQTVVATSSTEAEYVAAASCCAQEDASKQGEIVELDADENVTLMVAEEDVSADVQGRLAKSQAKVYYLDLKHAKKVFSMQDTDEAEPAEVEEVIEVVTAAKLIKDVVTTTPTTITASQVPKASAPRRRRGVIIQDPEEIATASVIVHSEAKSKDKGNGILIEEPKPLKRQAQIEQDEAFVRELEVELNANINWNDVMEQVKRKEKQDNTVMRYQALKRKPVEKKYPLTRFTLEHMLNNVRLEVEKESKMSLELLRWHSTMPKPNQTVRLSALPPAPAAGADAQALAD
nr:copia protein [Tanacetum cinerariifolium]